ncbi:MAG: glycosyltransferase [Nitrospira sp.]|nr:glycosyltransferase [Nitrospira sp.]
MKENLVSIIVRTKDRPKLLIRALQSIANQTYTYIEVVLVNDGGCDLDIKELQDILGSIPLNYIRLKKNTGRAHAGNTGIKNAQGEYVGFLDDDDEFYPDHVKTLIDFLSKSSFKIVYSLVERVEKEYNSDLSSSFIASKKTFSEKDFSFEELLVENYIPLLSLLFESQTLKFLMFDESFELFEDWDLLIRAAEKTKFGHIKKITSCYNQWGSSQIAFRSTPEYLKYAAQNIYEKHLNKFTPQLIYRLCVSVSTNHTGETKHLKELISEKESQILAMVNTKGWKYLEKYRRIREKAKRLFS